MLKLVGKESTVSQQTSPVEEREALEDHLELVEGFLKSHRVHNYQEDTIERRERFLKSWFKQHGPKHRPLWTWEAMQPVQGRKRIADYGQALIGSQISSSTVRNYLGILNRYFTYVLEHPWIIRSGITYRIQDRYGPIEHPVSRYDIPFHCRDEESRGIPLEPERLYEFFSILRKYYLVEGHSKVRGRNYAMIVLAGESGLRINELLHLEVRDLFFDSHKVQTRFAKATRGSGKRSRLTLFPPLARDTLRYYLRHCREESRQVKTDLLFPSRTGKPLSYSNVQKAIQEMVLCAQHAGFRVGSDLGWHDLRRVFATRFIERFPDGLPVLIHLLGHSSPNTVHAYIRHSEAWMNKQIQSVLEGSRSWPSIGN